MDEKEQLHMLLKSDVKQIDKPHKSLMPAPHLTAPELEDVLAFLAKRGQGSAPPAEWKQSDDFNVSFSRLRNAASEPQNWLTYWGDYQGTHYSRLASITPANVRSLAPKWSFQFGTGSVESVPLVVDGLMFVTGPQNNAAALDARTGRPIWRYTRPLPNVAAHCTVMANRGFAILGDRLFMGTLDSHLISLDAKTGAVIWDVAVEDYQKGFSITHAPLAIDGKIIIGITAGECALTRTARRGPTIRRPTLEADLPGQREPMMPKAPLCSGQPAILHPITTDRCEPARICTRAACSRSIPIPGR